jgi:Ran GTPase-activating protein (RanGAP) involved in mRNA processing and transport
MIYLRDENLTDDDMEIVVTHAIIKKQCKVLYLENNKITARGTSIIAAALKNNTRLETLNLCNNHVSDMGVKSLSETLSSQNSTLMLLDLGSNEITDLGAQYLAEMLKTNQTLVFLRLSFNQIGNQGIQLLTNVIARQNTSLQELYINGNKLISDLSTNSLVQMLKYHRALKTFYVDQCNLSKKCKRKLRQTVRWKLFFSIHT